MWTVKMEAFGTTEECEVEGVDVEDAMKNALREFGVEGNDGGSITIHLAGDAG